LTILSYFLTVNASRHSSLLANGEAELDPTFFTVNEAVNVNSRNTFGLDFFEIRRLPESVNSAMNAAELLLLR
jgi:hypothetical protein